MDVTLTRYDITATSASRDESVQEIVDRYMSNLEKNLQGRIGTIQVQS